MIFYLRESSTVFDMIDNINANELQVCFIVDVNKHLLGSITDGDIRRSDIRTRLNLKHHL